MRFTKMHGAGNDFVVLDLRPDRPLPSAELCRALADRRLGVGCDQILTIEPPRSAGAVAAYGIWNADGSRAGQCGNGARCVAAWLRRDAADTGLPLAGRFAIDSPGGRHAVECLDDGRIRLDMGRPAFEPGAIPLVGMPAAPSCTIDLDGGPVTFTAVSMGNPHAVIVVPEIGTAPVERIGRALQAHAAFPDSVNVGFAQVVDERHVRLRVYERGVGETLACGSGACAAAVALMREGRVTRSVDVQLPGGTLRIDWPGDDATVAMAGPAAFVFEGEWCND